jgi:hypothetical protein
MQITSNDVLLTDFLLILSFIFCYNFIKERYKSCVFFWDISSCWNLAIGANATNLMATTEYADFSIRGKSRLTFNQTVQKTRQVHPCLKPRVQLWRYGKLQSYCTSTFGGSNNEAVGKDSNMYEFMIGQEFLRIKQLILCLECQPIGRSTYCCCCIHWNCSFLPGDYSFVY